MFFVSLTFHFETQWKRKQVIELWEVHGDQVSLVHKAISCLDLSLVYILPAVHALTGCDTTSNFIWHLRFELLKKIIVNSI